MSSDFTYVAPLQEVGPDSFIADLAVVTNVRDIAW